MLLESFYISIANQVALTGYPYAFGTARGLSGNYITIHDKNNYDDQIFFDHGDCYYTKVEVEYRIHADSQTKAMQMFDELRAVLDVVPSINNGRYIYKTLDSSRMTYQL